MTLKGKERAYSPQNWVFGVWSSEEQHRKHQKRSIPDPLNQNLLFNKIWSDSWVPSWLTEVGAVWHFGGLPWPEEKGPHAIELHVNFRSLLPSWEVTQTGYRVTFLCLSRKQQRNIENILGILLWKDRIAGEKGAPFLTRVVTLKGNIKLSNTKYLCIG